MSYFEGLTPPYSTIVADPPWHYDARVITWGKSVPMPYSTMSTDEIGAMPVGSLAAPGSHLYLWTTNRHLEESFGIARRWGFEPITTLVWAKPPSGLGPGGRFSITTEFIVFARDTRRVGEVIRNAREAAGLTRKELHRQVRGGPMTGLVWNWEGDLCTPTPSDWEGLKRSLPLLRELAFPEVVASEQAKIDTTWWTWPRGRHSEKPAAFLDIVETVSPGPYVELFARAPRLGWDSWGKGYELTETAS